MLNLSNNLHLEQWMRIPPSSTMTTTFSPYYLSRIKRSKAWRPSSPSWRTPRRSSTSCGEAKTARALGEHRGLLCPPRPPPFHQLPGIQWYSLRDRIWSRHVCYDFASLHRAVAASLVTCDPSLPEFLHVSLTIITLTQQPELADKGSCLIPVRVRLHSSSMYTCTEIFNSDALL